MKPTIVVLHGVNGSSAEMAPVIRLLSPRFDVRAPDLLGHGGRDVPDGYTLEEMADDLVHWLDDERLGPAFLLGYSLGGYLALYLARFHPERVRGVIGIIVKHVYDEASLAHIAYLARPERIARPGNPRKQELEQIHGADKWIAVTSNTATLYRSFGRRLPLQIEDLKQIRAPVLLLSGEQDPLVTAQDSRDLAALLPNARLGLFPGTAHPLMKVPIVTAMQATKDFIGEVEDETFKPGPVLDLQPQLVTGGLIGRDIAATIRPLRKKP